MCARFRCIWYHRPIVAGLEPGSLCPAVLLCRHAWSCRDTGAHSLCPHTAKLPTVLSGDEIVRFLEVVASLRTRTALTTTYSGGLRTAEAVHLKVRDIDGERRIIRFEHGKGGKDRNDSKRGVMTAYRRCRGVG